jgi:hypothetical protein
VKTVHLFNSLYIDGFAEWPDTGGQVPGHLVLLNGLTPGGKVPGQRKYLINEDFPLIRFFGEGRFCVMAGTLEKLINDTLF